MSARNAKLKLLLTDRAVQDIADIEAQSTQEWGKRAASKYIAEIESALVRLQQKPDLLRPDERLHPQLRFYLVKKHLLVCDLQQNAIFLLTVIHASRDIPSRLAEVTPTLADEVEILRRQLSPVEKKRRQH